MKPSLWDLKPGLQATVQAVANHHEAIPMGFETIFARNAEWRGKKS